MDRTTPPKWTTYSTLRVWMARFGEFPFSGDVHTRLVDEIHLHVHRAWCTICWRLAVPKRGYREMKLRVLVPKNDGTGDLWRSPDEAVWRAICPDCFDSGFAQDEELAWNPYSNEIVVSCWMPANRESLKRRWEKVWKYEDERRQAKRRRRFKEGVIQTFWNE